MPQVFRNRPVFVLILASLLVVVLGVAACAPNPEEQLISPNMIPPGAGDDFVLPTPTPQPDIALLSTEQIVEGLPAEMLAAFPGDPESGENLVTLNACVGCHYLDPENVAVAPSWYNMANVAIVRNPEVGPAAYLYNSIVHPNEYIVDGYAAGIMPQTYGEALNPEQLADIISYLLTLRGDAAVE